MRTFKILVLAIAFFLCIGAEIILAEEAKTSDNVSGSEQGKAVHKVETEKGPVRQQSQESPISGSASMATLNRYIFRGYRIGESGLVFQPSLTASYKGFSVGFWGNIDTNQRNTTTATFNDRELGKKGFNETDLTLSYTYAIQKLSMTGGYIYYNLKYAEDTEEFFLTLAYDTILKPTLSVYQDVNAYLGTYVNLSFAHSFLLPKDISLDLSASFGYEAGEGRFWKTYQATTGGYTGSKYSAFHDGMVKAGLTIPVTKAFTVQPSLAYWLPLSGDARRTIGTDSTTGLRIPYNHNGYLQETFVYGVNFVYSF